MHNYPFDIQQQHTSFVFPYWLDDEEDDAEWLEEEYEDYDDDDENEESFKLADEDHADISDADF